MPKSAPKIALWRRILYFFPLQLVLILFKKHFLVLLYWFLLFSIVLEQFGVKYGVPNLLLYPEYLNRSNWLSHLILGFSVGGFIMAFNLSAYIVNGATFSFIATLARPFTKFVLNNFILPLLFVMLHLYKIYDYQLSKELLPSVEIAIHLLGYIAGLILSISLSLTYFLSTNTSVNLLFGKENENRIRKSFVKNLFYKNLEWYGRNYQIKDSHVETYLASPFKIGLARTGRHYKTHLLEKVFAQNHINASFFQILVVVSVFTIGSLREMALFNIPAGASFLLLLTLFIMLSSAIYTWIRAWSGLVFLAILLIANSLSKNTYTAYENRAYGLDYTYTMAYNDSALEHHAQDQQRLIADSLHTIKSLNNWKQRYMAKYGEKPTIVLLNTSGGGLRSAFWTFQNLHLLDSLTKGKFFESTFLINGSSGGMIGAAFYREIQLQLLQGNQIGNIRQLGDQLIQDLLNPIMMSIATNDLFLRYQTFSYDSLSYRKDRAYAFEQQFNKNTSNMLNHPLDKYSEAERNATIPWMIFAPAVNNDGRRMLISTQGISYLCNKTEKHQPNGYPIIENVEYSRFFSTNAPLQTNFVSVLRMNATFPYILPNVSLPTYPPIEVMDAGVRDNNGLLNTLKFAHYFENWIAENTEGLLIVQLNDIQDNIRIKSNPKTSFLSDLAKPAQGFTDNWLGIQKFHADDLMQQLAAKYKAPLRFERIELFQPEGERVSLSWHLTEIEKQRVRNGLALQSNQDCYKELIELLGPSHLLARNYAEEL